jgi:hypothetical protein
MGRAVAVGFGFGGVGVAVTAAGVDGVAPPPAVVAPVVGPLPRTVADGVGAALGLLDVAEGAAPAGIEGDGWPHPATSAPTSAPPSSHTRARPAVGAAGRDVQDGDDSGVRRTIRGANRCVTDRTDARQ